MCHALSLSYIYNYTIPYHLAKVLQTVINCHNPTFHRMSYYYIISYVQKHSLFPKHRNPSQKEVPRVVKSHPWCVIFYLHSYQQIVSADHVTLYFSRLARRLFHNTGGTFLEIVLGFCLKRRVFVRNSF